MTADDAPRTTDVPDAPSGRHGVLDVDGDPGTSLRWSRRAGATEVEVLAGDLDRANADRVTAAARAVGVVSALPAIADSRIHLAAEHPADHDLAFPTELAAALGFAPRRELLQLRRPLPVAADHGARRSAPSSAVRAFRPGADDAAWLRANNRAFAEHPDQGAETPGTLATRSSEPWFDRSGFLVVDDRDRDGELAGFCWTKVHDPTDDDPAIGEIYVIGVDPTHQGEGLGLALVLHGLDHLAGRGLTVANLYVEADNRPARQLYERLGFTVHTRRRVYSR